MNAAWLLALVAGCSFTSGRIGVDAHDSSGDASSGDVPVQPDDRDGDGVLDSNDNCADVVNASQRDFDMDGSGDECDLCPHVANAIADTDGDLIGDACDPRPSTGGDVRAAWNAFRDADEIAAWTATAGTWTLSAGGISQTDAAISSAGFGPPQGVQKAFVMTQMQFDSVGNSVDEVAGISTGSDAPTQYYACATGMHDPGPVQFIGAFTKWAASGGQQQSTAGWAGAVVGGTFQITDNPVSSLECTFKQVGQSDVTLTAPGGLGPTNGGVYVYTQYAAATFRYMFVVEIGS
jgi:hypothetical protein